MGCMAFSHGYDRYRRRIQRGSNPECLPERMHVFDTAEIYSPNLSGIGHNSTLWKSTVWGKGTGGDATKLFLNGFEAVGKGSVYNAVRRHLEGSLTRLGTDRVDLYYLHRMGGVSVEKIAEAMGRLMEDGLIRGWGLSQVDVPVIKKANGVTPLSAVQNIYSMVERDAEQGVIPYCLENNIGFVPFSPIASGILSGKITVDTRFERHDDVRNWVPQLSKANIAGNQPIIDLLKKFAEMKNATSAQISLAWMLHKYPNVVPIPGSKNKERIVENLDASKVELTDEEFRSLEEALNGCRVYGHRGFCR